MLTGEEVRSPSQSHDYVRVSPADEVGQMREERGDERFAVQFLTARKQLDGPKESRLLQVSLSVLPT